MKRLLLIALLSVALLSPIVAPASAFAQLGVLPATRNRVADLEKRVGFLEGWTKALETRVNRHNARLNGHDAELDALKPYVAGLATRAGLAEHALGVAHEKKYALVAGFARGQLDKEGNLVSCGGLTKAMIEGLKAIVADVDAGARVSSVAGYASTEPFMIKGKLHPDTDTLNLACAKARAQLVAKWLTKELGVSVTGLGNRHTDQFGSVAAENRGVVIELVWDVPRTSDEFTIDPPPLAPTPATVPPASNP